MPCTFILTIPPSVNHLYQRRGRHTFKTKRYKDWILENTLSLEKTHPHKKYPCTVQITIVGGAGWRKTRDLDNTAKAVLDLMQSINVLAEDNTDHIQTLIINFKPAKSAKLKDQPPAYCVVVIY